MKRRRCVTGALSGRLIFESNGANMKRTVLKACLTAVLAAGGFNATSTENALVLKFSHPREITNFYLPLMLLEQDVLGSSGERVERTVKPDVHKTFTIFGQTVAALAIEDREYADGKLAEVTLDYFAQADDGAVYYLGEDVDEYKNGKIVGHSGAWLLGRDTQKPGVLIPAHPKVGDRFRSEEVPKITWEADEVVSISETVTVPAGTWTNCLKIKERTSGGDTEYKFYVPGVGCVKEVESSGELSLKSHKTR